MHSRETIWPTLELRYFFWFISKLSWKAPRDSPSPTSYAILNCLDFETGYPYVTCCDVLSRVQKNGIGHQYEKHEEAWGVRKVKDEKSERALGKGRRRIFTNVTSGTAEPWAGNCLRTLTSDQRSNLTEPTLGICCRWCKFEKPLDPRNGSSIPWLGASWKEHLLAHGMLGIPSIRRRQVRLCWIVKPVLQLPRFPEWSSVLMHNNLLLS